MGHLTLSITSNCQKSFKTLMFCKAHTTLPLRHSIKLMQPPSLRGHVKSHVNKFPTRRAKSNLKEEFQSLYSCARPLYTTYPIKEEVLGITLKITDAILFLVNVSN